MVTTGSKKIILLDDALEIAVPSGKTVEVTGPGVPPSGFLRQNLIEYILDRIG